MEIGLPYVQSEHPSAALCHSQESYHWSMRRREWHFSLCFLCSGSYRECFLNELRWDPVKNKEKRKSTWKCVDHAAHVQTDTTSNKMATLSGRLLWMEMHHPMENKIRTAKVWDPEYRPLQHLMSFSYLLWSNLVAWAVVRVHKNRYLCHYRHHTYTFIVYEGTIQSSWKTFLLMNFGRHSSRSMDVQLCV